MISCGTCFLLQGISAFWSPGVGGLHFQVEKCLHKIGFTLSFILIFSHLKPMYWIHIFPISCPQGRILRTAFCLFHFHDQKDVETGQDTVEAEVASEPPPLLILVARFLSIWNLDKLLKLPELYSTHLLIADIVSCHQIVVKGEVRLLH